jgi:hypothetical protein
MPWNLIAIECGNRNDKWVEGEAFLFSIINHAFAVVRLGSGLMDFNAIGSSNTQNLLLMNSQDVAQFDDPGSLY